MARRPQADDDDLVPASELDWDDVVDVICAGVGPGVLAHAVLCSQLGLTVELEATVSPFELADPDTAAYLSAMADDLGPLPDVSGEVPVIHAEPVEPRTDRRARIEPFIGSRLRDWSARCLTSPFGVVYSAVPEAGVTVMRTGSGETARVAVLGDYRPDTDRVAPALAGWLAEQAGERGLLGRGRGLQRLVFENGQVAGAAIDTASGTRLVRALGGVAMSTGSWPAGAEWPAQPGVRDSLVQVAIVGRTGSRFGRLELLAGL